MTDPKQPKKLVIAVLSDLHCQLRSATATQESFLFVGQPRIPAARHPIEALNKLIKECELTADLLMCAGDITNRSSQEGLVQGWDFLSEIKRELNSNKLICTLGNHDVDSRKSFSQDPFLIAQSVNQLFPLEDQEQIKRFWGSGFSVIEHNSNALIVILNSVADHTDELTAKRGSFAERRLEELRHVLDKYSHNDFPLRIAMLHHHPILHSFMNYTSEDVLSNGDQLIELLSQNRFNLIIHGHRHQPRLRRHSSCGNPMIIFAAGSFAAMLGSLASTTRNLFHILTISMDEANLITFNLRTWEHNPNDGWIPTSKKSSSLPYLIKFRGNHGHIDAQSVRDYLDAQQIAKMDAAQLFKAFPELEFYFPDEFEAFERDIQSVGLRLVFDDQSSLYEIGRIIGR